MDKLEELRDLKKLLDEGVIDEEDFTIQKRRLLDLDLPEKKEEPIIEREESQEESLEEYEKELRKEVEEAEKSQDETKDELNNYYEKMRLQELGKLDAHEEVRKERIAERNAAVNTGVNKLKNLFKWVLTMFLLISGVGTLVQPEENFVLTISAGILFIILGIMACPTITGYTKEFRMYTKLKTIIAIVLTLILLVLLFKLGSHLAA